VITTASSSNVTCASSTVELELTGTTGTAAGGLTGDVKNITFNTCSLKDPFGVTHNCNNITAGPFMGRLLKISASTGNLTTENVFINLVCPGFIECSFGGTDLVLPFKEGNPATVTALNTVLEKEPGGFLCPEETKLDAAYTTTGGVFIV
jgi:hypothetical protein